MSATPLKRASALRRRFEQWFDRRYGVRYGPYMYRRRGEYVFIDYRGNRWRLIPTDGPWTRDGGPPLIMQLEEKQ